MADILKSIQNRRAKRALDNKKIDSVTIKRLFEAAHLAPSCMNKQSWRFVAVTEASQREKVAEALTKGNYWAKKAPLYVAALYLDDLDCNLPDGRKYAQFDLGMASMNLMLQAEEEGLIAHPMAGFKQSDLKEALEIPEDYTLLTLFAVAYPGDDSDLSEKHKESEVSERTRIPVEQILHYEKW